MFANLKNSRTHEFNFFVSFKKLKRHEIKFLQVDTHRAFDSGSVYFIRECQGLILDLGMSRYCTRSPKLTMVPVYEMSFGIVRYDYLTSFETLGHTFPNFLPS